jgi:DNA-binding LytR/AlgR family response regulator
VRIAICDDDALELGKIKEAVLEFIQSKQAEAEITLNAFSNGPELLNYISRTASFDLIVLDILMPYMTGINAAAQVRKTNSDTKIIFLTSSPEFAVDSYKVNAFYYLVKPFQKQEFMSLLDKAYVSMQSDTSGGIVVKEKAGLKRIPLHLIEYAESVKHTLNFHLRGGETVTCYAKMGDYREALLNDTRFVHCHQSFIVNMGRVAQITSKYFVMLDQTQIPISRTVYPKVKQDYIQYFFHKEKDF